MGSWWRSEDMTYISLILSEEAAPSCIRELGALGCIEFSDLNPELTPFQRRFVSNVKRCDEIERKIRYLSQETKKLDIPIQPVGTIDNFIKTNGSLDPSSGSYLLESLENRLNNFEVQLLELNRYSDKLSEEFRHKVEYHHLLIKSRIFLGEANNIQKLESEFEEEFEPMETGLSMAPLVSEERGLYQSDEMSFSNIAGTLPSEDKNRFERMIFRATRGNCYIRFSPLNEKAVDAFGKFIDKTCFVIFYKSNVIEAKIKKICDAFSANRYDLSNLNHPYELDAQQQQNKKEMMEAKTILDKNIEARISICVEIAAHIEEWLWVVRREKGVYHTLNLFKNDIAGNLLRGRGWILTSAIQNAKLALQKAQSSLNLHPTAMLERVEESWPTPPTHFNTNKYTWAFQEFVNTYGVPRYKEANPALFTAATFPFLFGVMYGDIGHGSVLALAGLYLIVTEYKANERGLDEMLKGVYSARYMLFAMGLMAVYAGLVYNDFFSIGLNFFGSKWVYEDESSGAKATLQGSYGDPSTVYTFGVDPAWKISENELLFFNSLKMKMSVILGIFQMTFGIILKGLNSIYFRSYLDLFCEFIPMILFDIALFGYMVVLIFVKWSINWDQRMAMGTCSYDALGNLNACDLSNSANGYCYSYSGNKCYTTSTLADVCPLNYGGSGDGCQPPNLITTLINIVLKPGEVDEPMFYGQAGVQSFLLFVVLICVPWLLLVKPFYLRKQHQSKTSYQRLGAANPLLSDVEVMDHSDHDAHRQHDSHSHEEEFNFGEIFIHQAIETIEFVLGMVSNTASYLRLWALSLAHTELATVFWEKAMVSTIVTNNPVLIFMGFAVFASVTFGVLLCMDVLECFLHALRLHWVEFQNKFYRADGHRFQPFDFKSILEKALIE